MHKLSLPSLIGVVGLLLPLAGHCAEPPAPLTWENCVQIAEQQNPALVSARKQVQAKESLFYSSYNSVLPSLSVGYSYFTNSQIANDWEQQFQGNLQWDLFNWKDYASISLASATLTQARCDWLLASAQVRFQLRAAFFQLVFAQEQIGLLEQILKIRQDNARMIKLEYNSGKESKGNMLITQADFAASEADLAQAKRNLQVAQQALNHAMGRDDIGVVVVKNEFYLPLAPKWDEITAHIPELPQVKRDDAFIEESRASVQQANSQVLPNVSANYSRGWQGQTFFPQNAEWNASLSLNWPIFANGPIYSYFAITAAQDQLAKAEADKQADLQQLRASVENAWSNLMQMIEQVAVQKQYLEAALQRNDEATIEYSNGLLVFENWNQVVTALVTYEKQYLASRLNAVLAENSWQNALATTLEEK